MCGVGCIIFTTFNLHTCWSVGAVFPISPNAMLEEKVGSSLTSGSCFDFARKGFSLSELQALREMGEPVFEVENDSRNSGKGNFTNFSEFFKGLNQFTTIVKATSIFKNTMLMPAIRIRNRAVNFERPVNGIKIRSIQVGSGYSNFCPYIVKFTLQN